MESWRRVWREGLEPLLSPEALEALSLALVRDDPRLLQGATTSPPPLQCVQDWPVEAACALGFCGWQGENLHSVAEVEEFLPAPVSRPTSGSASWPAVAGSSTGLM